MRKKQANHIIVSVILCVALCTGIFSGCGPRGSAVDVEKLTVEPSSLVDGTIPPDCTFTVSSTGRGAPNANTVQEMFRIEPEAEFSVKKPFGKPVQIIPKEPLKRDAIVNVQAVDSKGQVLRSWAFQTEAGFSVKRTTPEDGSGWVPLTTGIEVVFTNANVTAEAFQSSFRLQKDADGSDVSGHVEKFAETLVFVPDDPLDASTIYTATVGAELTTAGGTALEETFEMTFQTQRADDEAYEDNFANYSPVTETFVKGDSPVIAVNCGDAYTQDADFQAEVSIYRFRTAEDYASLLNGWSALMDNHPFPDTIEPPVDPSKLEPLGEHPVSLTVPKSDNYWGPRYLILPGDYDYGWYYARVRAASPLTGKETILHKFLQINDTSVYYMQADENTAFWVNDSATGQPAANAKVSLSGTASADGTTDASGTLLLSAPSPEGNAPVGARRRERSAVLTIDTGNGFPYLDLYSPLPQKEPLAREQYLSYLYTDRPIYKSTDTIQAWGVVRPRSGGVQPPENLRLVLEDGGEELYTVPITLAPDGTFTAELSFEKLGGMEINYTNLSLYCGVPEPEDDSRFHRSDKQQLSSIYLDIGDYVKPVYTTSVSADKAAYFAGEPANLTFTASFFDNTPAAGFTAEMTHYPLPGGNSQNQTLVTGEDGKAQAVVPLSMDSSTDWRPTYQSVSVSNQSGENENVWRYLRIPVFRSDTALRGEVTGEGASKKLTVQVNRIDLSGLKTADDVYEQENYLAEPLDRTVTVSIHRNYYERVEAGSYYDFIQKRNVTFYSYSEHDVVESTNTYQSRNGTFEVTGLPQSDENSWYYALLSTTDGSGRQVTEKVWLGDIYRPYSYGLHSYALKRPGIEEDYDNWQAQYAFKDDETAEFTVQDNGLPVNEGKLFWIMTQSSVVKTGVESSPKLSIPFDESLLPNYDLYGAYFDGKYVFRVSGYTMEFDPSERELDIGIKAGKETYAPGETAEIEVTATVRKTGKPAEGAAVSLSVVDEAVFAIAEQTVEPLETLYRTAYLIEETSYYVSYHEYNLRGDSGAEKGGGGGDESIRDDFEDTAAFLTGTTGADGKVKFTIDLPDNITSWRATAQAVTKDLYAGDGRTPVISTKPFFLNEVLSETLIEGDKATLTLRGAGRGITGSSTVDYTLSLTGPGGASLEQSGSGSAYEYTVLSLGQPSIGDYKVLLTGKTGEFQDAIEKPVQVIRSGLETSLSRTFNLKDGISIQPEKFPVVVGFCNADYLLYSDVLGHILCTWGPRTDQRAARKFAQEKIAALTEEQSLFTPSEEDFGDVLDTDGAVKLFPYDSANIQLSARFHLAVPEYRLNGDPKKTFQYTIGNEESTKSDLAAAYLGLAANKAPILPALREIVQSAAEYSDEDRLYLIAALAAIGDSDKAKEQYDSFIAPKLKRDQTPDLQETVYWDSGDANTNLEMTARASLTASLLHSPDADGMMRYLMANRSTQDLYLLEQIVYLRNMEPQATEKAKISYQKGGKQQSLDLGKLGIQYVRFTSEDFDTTKIRLESGDVQASAYYTGNLEEAMSQENRKITVSKAVEASTEGEALKPGTIVKITITPTMDETINPGYLTVDDYIPSGMRYLGMKNSWDVPSGKSEYSDGWQLSKREGQRVSFTYLKSQRNEYEIPVPGEKTYFDAEPLVYYARCATPGEYVVEGAYANAYFAPVWGVSDRHMVTILE